VIGRFCSSLWGSAKLSVIPLRTQSRNVFRGENTQSRRRTTRERRGNRCRCTKIQSTPRLSSTTKALDVRGGSPRVIQRSSAKFAVRSIIRIEHTTNSIIRERRLRSRMSRSEIQVPTRYLGSSQTWRSVAVVTCFPGNPNVYPPSDKCRLAVGGRPVQNGEHRGS